MNKIIDAEAAKLAGLQIDLLQKVRNGQITLDQLGRFNNLSSVDREARFGGNKTENAILRLLSGGENIIIPACDGSETIASTKEIFAYIDHDFEKYGLNKPGKTTVEMSVKVYETAKNEVTFVQMFGSLGADLDKLCLSQHQIISFCKSDMEWLCADGNATFFLLKSGGQFFVVRVSVYPDGLFAHVRQFGKGAVFGADHPCRLVTPQL